MSDENVVHAFRIADADAVIQHVFIRDLTVTALIGVYRHEKENPQPIRINLVLAVKEKITLVSGGFGCMTYYEMIN